MLTPAHRRGVAVGSALESLEEVLRNGTLTRYDPPSTSMCSEAALPGKPLPPHRPLLAVKLSSLRSLRLLKRTGGTLTSGGSNRPGRHCASPLKRSGPRLWSTESRFRKVWLVFGVASSQSNRHAAKNARAHYTCRPTSIASSSQGHGTSSYFRAPERGRSQRRNGTSRSRQSNCGSIREDRRRDRLRLGRLCIHTPRKPTPGRCDQRLS